MKTFTKLGFAAALLAGSALTTNAVIAQEAQQPKMEQPGADTSAKPKAPGQTKTEGQADSGGTAGEPKPNENAATEEAPGQKQKAGQADATDAAPGQQQKNEQAGSAQEAAPGQAKQDQAEGESKPSDETTASVDISTEQKTEIRTVIQETKVEPADVDIDISVGVAVPTTVEFHPLPARIVEIVPQYRGYEYFVLADGRIIIVEPSSHEVVYIIVV